MSSRNARCIVLISGLGPFKVDNFFFSADNQSIRAYFNGSSFNFTTEECTFTRQAEDRRIMVTKYTRPMLARFKRAYHIAVDFEIDFDD